MGSAEKPGLFHDCRTSIIGLFLLDPVISNAGHCLAKSDPARPHGTLIAIVFLSG